MYIYVYIYIHSHPHITDQQKSSSQTWEIRRQDLHLQNRTQVSITQWNSYTSKPPLHIITKTDRLYPWHLSRYINVELMGNGWLSKEKDRKKKNHQYKSGQQTKISKLGLDRKGEVTVTSLVIVEKDLRKLPGDWPEGVRSDWETLDIIEGWLM